MSGRRLRGGSKGSDAPHYAQITLGIEKDHSSDEDFTPGNEGAVLDDQKALKTRKQSARKQAQEMSSRKTGRPGGTRKTSAHEEKESKRPDIENILKKVETGEKMENGEEVDSNKKVESAEGGEIVESVEAPKNMESGHSVEGSERGENGESEVEKQASKRRVESVDSVKSAKNVENKDTVESVGSTEYLEGVDTMASSEGDFDGYKPRKRGSQHIAELDTMAVQQEQNVNIIASFPKVPTK
ncbi:hypothetical protein F443_19328 [Phytophthora nicotianae P1569]|uniref:Uncharacterized protein n=1 Tax=Phytophthora nicotianae P1569 TaxID=1317065 RepID=V9E6F4_PHYNI|nr:hypothetical protein F443_19328 [Phytophthora nicotianae P1569]